jgi:DNA-binding transcriptional ArsR family regulator
MDYVISLKKRLAENEAAIASLKDKLAALEMDQHRLGIALEVVASMAPEPIIRGSSAPATRGTGQLDLVVADPPVAGLRPTAAKLNGKRLIVRTLEETSFPLTRMAVISRLAEAGHTLNPSSVGPTLSRLVEAGLIEKASHSHYRAKSIAPAVPDEEH